ncbi:tetratricopeptide repeat protein [Arthrobacter sp. PAMC25564]|uniref:tetratricopeptide repeat protein n=1 Tax=Arthrobacter sp. PAMC25564 TaxID=2565366 RepID=UPI001447EF2F|nr:tetratricopeptide repeat protein [Arthrobacter sp. PAMC25564]
MHLETPFGWGKTRLAHEFYARLASARQEEPAYWPESILATTERGQEKKLEVSSRRKRTHPAVTHTPGSSPAWMWWGVTCAERNGIASLPLVEELRQFEAHAPYLDIALGRRRNDLTWGEVGHTVTDELVNEGLAHAVEALTSASVPGLGLVTSLGKRIWALNGDRLARRHTLAADDLIFDFEGGGAIDVVDAAFALVGGIARRGLPVVIFVEDVHNTDSTFAELLGRLIVEPEISVMILTSAWTGHSASNEALMQAMARKPERVEMITHEMEEWKEPFAPSSSLEELEEADLTSILRFYYPGVENTTARALVLRYRNPLELELFCQIPKFKARFSNRELKLSKADLNSLPATMKELYRAVWLGIPEKVRRGLSLAALSIPAVIDPEGGFRRRWSQQWLDEIICEVDFPQPDEVEEVVDVTPVASSWARIVAGVLREFHERDQMDVAKDDWETYLWPDELKQVHELLKNKATAHLQDTESGDDAETMHAAQVLLALDSLTPIDPNTLAASIHYVLEHLADNHRELFSRISLAEYALKRVEKHSDFDLRIRYLYGRCLVAAEQGLKAMDVFAELLTDWEPTLGSDHKSIQVIRWSYADSMVSVGSVAASIPVYEAVLKGQERELGSSHPYTLATRSSLAGALSQLGHVQEAIRRYEEILKVRTSCLGNDDRRTLKSRSDLAAAFWKAGRLQDAIDQYELTAADYERVLGLNDPDTWIERTNLAAAYSEAGRLQEAEPIYVSVLTAQKEAVGESHPTTQATRFNIAGLHSKDPERLSESIAEYESLLSYRTEMIGSEHPDTLHTRHSLAMALSNASRLREAIALYLQVSAERARILGQNHPDTLHSLCNLAAEYMKDGRWRPAISGYEDVLLGRTTALGADHPDTLACQHGLGMALAGGGRLAAAIETYETVLEGRTKVLGADHPETLDTLNNLAISYMSAERVDDAIAADELALAAIERTRGVDHADALALRSYLAAEYKTAGRIEEAVKTYSRLLQDQHRLLGPEHPDTKDTLASLDIPITRDRKE